MRQGNCVEAEHRPQVCCTWACGAEPDDVDSAPQVELAISQESLRNARERARRAPAAPRAP